MLKLKQTDIKKTIMLHNLTAHMIVKNEEQWLWYAVKSVIDYVDQMLIYDTGSADKTVEIIKTYQNPKIIFKQKESVNSQQLVDLRNQQIKQTRTGWFLLVDGDEVWPKDTIKELIASIGKIPQNKSAIVVPMHVPVGDLHHYQSKSAGRYKLLGLTGHFNIRAYRIKTNNHWQGIYPLEAYVDSHHVPIQDRLKELILLNNKYWHLTYLPRSSQDDHHKRKIEIGLLYLGKIPEVFNLPHPDFVPSPDVKFNKLELLIAKLITPILNIKRMLFK